MEGDVLFSANSMFAVALATSLIAGCANPRDIGRINDSFRIEPGRANALAKPTEEGVFNTSDGKIAVKYSARSLLSVIDELAYKLNFNYTVLSDLTRFRVTIKGVQPALSAEDDPAFRQFFGDDESADNTDGKQKIFENEIELLNELKSLVNADLATLGIRNYVFDYTWVSDGPEFALRSSVTGSSSAPFCFSDGNCEKSSFKKLFLKNITSEEAARAINDLFSTEVELRRVSESNITPTAAPGTTGNAIGMATYGGGFSGQFGGQFGGQLGDPTGNAGMAKKASLLQYKPQNALIVRSEDPKVYSRIAGILPSLDASFKQVLVETQVFEYDDSIARRIGAALSYSKDTTTGNGAKTGITTLFGEGITNALPTFLYQLTNLEKKAALLGTLALFDKDGLVRILAEPRLVLKSGEEAEVKLETRRYYLTAGNNSPGDLKDLPTGIDFKVIPTVLGDDKILLNLFIRQSEFIPTNDVGVAASTNHNEIRTSVIARDGELVSIGGIHLKKDSKFSSGIPGMRHIPGVGALFGSEAQDASVVRVDFMIRPTVARTKDVLDQKLKSIRDVNCRINQQMGRPDPACMATTPKSISPGAAPVGANAFTDSASSTALQTRKEVSQ